MGSYPFESVSWIPRNPADIYTRNSVRSAFTGTGGGEYRGKREQAPINISVKNDFCIAGVLTAAETKRVMNDWFNGITAIKSISIPGVDRSCLINCNDTYGNACAIVVTDETRKLPSAGKGSEEIEKVKVKFFGWAPS